MQLFKTFYVFDLFVAFFFWIWTQSVESINLKTFHTDGNVRDMLSMNSSLLNSVNGGGAWSPVKYSFINTKSYSSNASVMSHDKEEDRKEEIQDDDDEFYLDDSSFPQYYGSPYENEYSNSDETPAEEGEAEAVAEKLADKVSTMVLSYLENASKSKDHNEKHISSGSEETIKYADNVAKHMGKDVHEHLNENLLNQLKAHLNEREYSELLSNLKHKTGETVEPEFILKSSEAYEYGPDPNVDDMTDAVIDELVEDYLESEDNPLENIDKEIDVHDFSADNSYAPESTDKY